MKVIKLGDKEYRLADIDVAASKKLLEWAKPRLTDPVQFILKELASLPEHLKAEVLKEHLAMKRQPVTLDSPDMQALLRTPEGSEFVVMLMWQTNNPELSTEQVWELHQQAVDQYGDDYAK